MSDQWPSCPSCGGKGTGRPRKRLNLTAQYLGATTLTTIGALIYGAQFLGRDVSPGLMRAALVMMAVGVLWYGSLRIIALFR